MSARRGRRWSRRPGSSSARPTCSTSTGASSTARSATPTRRRCPTSTRARCGCSRRSPRRCCGWASIPKASCAPMRADVGRLLERLEPSTPPSDAHLDARQGRSRNHPCSGGVALMNFAAFLPEILLTVGAIVLMMVAAFMGRRGSRGDDVAVGRAADRRDGLAARRAAVRRADLRRAGRRRRLRRVRQDADLPRRRGGDHRRAQLVRARFRACRRISGADPAVVRRHGGDGLGDQPDVALRRARAAEPVGLRPRRLPPHRRPLGRGGPQIFRPRRARQRHPALRHFSLLYGFTGTIQFDGIAAAFARDGVAVARPAVRAGVPARRPGLQDQRGAVPHVDPRRLRRRADPGDRFLRLGAQGRRGAARGARVPRRARARRSTRGARS